MKFLPGPQLVVNIAGTVPGGAWCSACGDTVTKPHDLVRDCAPELDRRARDARTIIERRDAVAAVVREQMRQEAKS